MQIVDLVAHMPSNPIPADHKRCHCTCQVPICIAALGRATHTSLQSGHSMRSFRPHQQGSAAVRGPASHANQQIARCRCATINTATQSKVAGLTQEQIEGFHRDGFLALPGFASKEQVSAMMQRCHELVEEWDPQAESRRFSVFSTKEEQSHAKVGS